MIDEYNEALPEFTVQSVVPPHLQKPRLRRWEAAEYLRAVHGISMATATLAKLASVGGGPRFQKGGRAAYYPTTELDAWSSQKLGRIQRSTSDVAGIR